MNKFRLGAVLALFTLTCSAASAATVWRSPFGTAYAVAVNPTDGTVWAATGGSVMHLTAAGEIISQSNGFYEPQGLAVNPSDGSCWVADNYLIPKNSREAEYGAVVHLASDGSEVWRSADVNHPSSVSVDPADGSCWVAAGSLYHLAADGSLLPERPGVGIPQSVAVDPRDRSVWVADVGYGRLFHLTADGSELWVGEGLDDPWSVTVSPTDGSCWVAENSTDAPAVSHYSAEGALLWRVPTPSKCISVAADPWDGTVWVDEWDFLAHLGADGVELWRGATHVGITSCVSGGPFPCTVAVSSVDGAVWLTDGGNQQVIRVDRGGPEQRFQGALHHVPCLAVDPSDGTLWAGSGLAGYADLGGRGIGHFFPSGLGELWRGLDDARVQAIAVNPSDGSCWAGVRAPESGFWEVIHLARTGEELWRGGFHDVVAIAVNPMDGSCWAADVDTVAQGEAVTHLSAEGEVLWYGEGLSPVSLAVSPVDGSWWAADRSAGAIIRFAPDGTELWRRAYAVHGGNWEISVNPSDGACWVAATDLILLDAHGAELWKSSLDSASIEHVATDPYDGSCWAGANYYNGPFGLLLQMASDGTIRERLGGFLGITGYYPALQPVVCVDPRDGSCWVADWRHGQIVHLNAGCAPFRDVPCDYWALAYILACYNAGLVSGYGDYTYRPEQVVTRGQMAVYVSRALAGGDAYVPTGPATATFPDVPTGYWAFRYVEYCHDRGVVGGYADGYRPEEIVNRAQMAVYVSRAIAGGDGGVPPGPGTASFPDVPTTQWAFRYIEYCKANGVVGGYPDGSYHPDEAVNRAQMAVYVARAFALPM